MKERVAELIGEEKKSIEARGENNQQQKLGWLVVVVFCFYQGACLGRCECIGLGEAGGRKHGGSLIAMQKRFCHWQAW